MQQAPAVLHLGWMYPAIAALIRSGAAVTCAVKPADAPAVRAMGARAVVVSDPARSTDVLAGLDRAGLAPDVFDVVCSGMEFCLLDAAAVSGDATAIARALAMRDKFIQKRAVREAGVRTADCAVLEAPGAAAVLPSFPQVLKPLDGAGARNTFLVADEQDLAAVLRQPVVAATGGPWLLEEYVPGVEFQVDGFVEGGELRLLSISRYVQNLIEVHSGGLVANIVLPPRAHPELYAKVGALAEAAFKALGHHDGIFHLEVFQHAEDGDIVFGECGARVGGGRTDEVIERAFGVRLHDVWARLATGRPSGVTGFPGHVDGTVFGGMLLSAQPGLIRAVPSDREVLDRPGVVYSEVTAGPGTVLPDTTEGTHLWAGLAVVSGADEQEVEDRMRRLADWFTARVVYEAAD
ncbi:ATP-grasp domain-containing protein [Streptomyces sp. SLBN-8D4]|jgi:phosphoribosylaminoimidazole carboxylase (NCAIR synthetase)|uniref:ATP-grasp domain-containing protein n=1 Tax=Streptomyces sp. SLBN-8D4 TaxID=3377728 RepID=UPI003C7CAFA1